MKVGIITTLIVFISSGILFGTINLIDSAQIAVPTCIDRTKPDCIEGMPKPICSLSNNASLVR